MSLKGKAKAPTKVTLFGEHSVVYGYPALVFSLPLYIEVEAQPSDDVVVITGPANLNVVDLVLRDNGVEVGEETKKHLSRYASYIIKSIESMGVKGVTVRIDSPLPVGAGLGTSAAVTVGTIAAILALLGKDVRKEDVAKMAWEIEKAVQGKASPMDTAASALGGVLWIERKDEWIIERVSAPEIKLVIGVFEKKKTTAELVREVSERLGKKELYSKVMELMGDISRDARKALERNDLMDLGELMNLNHAMLEALGVVNKEVSRAVHYAREAGALGAKVSGAGWGGAVVALVEDDPKPVASALKVAGARKVFAVNEPSKGVEFFRML